MGKVKMTIHRGLVELKTLNDRIIEATDSFEAVGRVQIGKPVVGTTLTEEKFTERARAQLQSITDLIARKQAVKGAIVHSNAITMVTIGKANMSVADAINKKSVIELLERLSTRLKQLHKRELSVVTVESETLMRTALENAKIILGREQHEVVTITDADVKAIVDPFVARQELKVVDPLDALEVARRIDEEATEFLLDVDALLSESNATTFIEV